MIYKGDIEKKCQSEGGHLMNIDTKERWIDLVDITNNKGSIWVDGMRQMYSGPWTFQEGSNPPTNGIVQWYPREPSNQRVDLCLKARTWFY